MPTFFTPQTLTFLRALKRNNNRDWFRARKEDYERHVRGPMLQLVEQLATDFKTFAPEFEASPKTSLYRIYRDTRFSGDKTPLKTHIAATFRQRGFPKNEGAGLYVEVAPGWVWIGGGFYAPETSHLTRIRQHISETYPEMHRICARPAFRRAVGTLDGERLTRIPLAFARNDPAGEYLKYRNFLAGREFPAALATSDRFYPTLVATFKAIRPLVTFINEALERDGGKG
jgi:uncharacterized protein (TIGR02453 family)